MKLFLDTEFSSLQASESRLISLALVAEDERWFYAELPPTTYLPTCSEFVKTSVLPGLRGMPHELEPDDLTETLRVWLGQFDFADVVTDAPARDFPFLRTALNETTLGWPSNIAGGAYLFTPPESLIQEYFTTPGRFRHNALDDAHALRMAWSLREKEKQHSIE